MLKLSFLLLISSGKILLKTYCYVFISHGGPYENTFCSDECPWKSKNNFIFFGCFFFILLIKLTIANNYGKSFYFSTPSTFIIGIIYQSIDSKEFSLILEIKPSINQDPTDYPGCCLAIAITTAFVYLF